MALGYLGSNAQCHLNTTAAMYDLMTALYPRLIANTTAALTTATSGYEVITAQSVNATGLITYSTKNQQTNVALQTNKTIQMMQCDNTVYGLDNVNGAGYDYTAAAAMWGFAFSSVFMLWYLAKNLGSIIAAVRRW